MSKNEVEKIEEVLKKAGAKPIPEEEKTKEWYQKAVSDLDEQLSTIRKKWKERIDQILEDGEKLFNSLDYDESLALTAFFFKILLDHAKEGGTYRYLIYDRLGFSFAAYGVLQMAGALAIHNLISGELKDGKD